MCNIKKILLVSALILAHEGYAAEVSSQVDQGEFEELKGQMELPKNPLNDDYREVPDRLKNPLTLDDESMELLRHVFGRSHYQAIKLQDIEVTQLQTSNQAWLMVSHKFTTQKQVSVDESSELRIVSFILQRHTSGKYYLQIHLRNKTVPFYVVTAASSDKSSDLVHVLFNDLSNIERETNKLTIHSNDLTIFRRPKVYTYDAGKPIQNSIIELLEPPLQNFINKVLLNF